MQQDLVCYTCRGTDFYEDRQGNFTCQRCGALSQDYFAESYEVEGLVAARGMRTIKTKTSKKQKVQTVEEITAVECVTVYQECLRNLAKIVAGIIGSDQLEAVVRSIWFEYLDMWQCRGWGMRLWFSRSSHAGAYGSTETMEVARRPKSRAAAPDTPKKNLFDIGLDYFSESDTDDDCTLDGTATDTTKERIVDDKVAGLAPSKPLLLGFLYLACRQLRSWVIPADLVRWCQTGALPLSNLWESDCIPVAYRERFNSVPKSFEKKVFSAFFRSETSLPTVSNVWFQTVLLADTLSLPLPPLNAPIVARRIITSLGLPEAVLERYVDLTRVRGTVAVPVRGSDPFGEHYVENIAATLMVACKLCPRWRAWSLERLSTDSSVEEGSWDHGSVNKQSRFGPFVSCVPVRVEDISMLLNDQNIDAYVQHVSGIALPSVLARLPEGGRGSYNNLLEQFFSSSDYRASEPELNLEQGCLLSHNKTVWKSQQFVIDPPQPQLPYSSEEKKLGSIGNKRKRVKKTKKFIAEQEQQLHAYQLAPDSTDCFDPQYTVLLERISRHVGIWPGVLHQLLHRLEMRIYAFAKGPTPAEDVTATSIDSAATVDSRQSNGAIQEMPNDISDEDDLPLTAVGTNKNKRRKLLPNGVS